MSISTVCFTGHRPSDLGTTPEVAKLALRKAINDAIQHGATAFITGGAVGVDTYAAQLVLEAKATHPNIKLYIAIPFRGFTKYWSDAQRNEYADTIRKCDGFKVVCDAPSKRAYHIRNHFMVDHADLVIAYWSGKCNGGTYATVQYAQQTGTPIVNCYPKTEPTKTPNAESIIKYEHCYINYDEHVNHVQYGTPISKETYRMAEAYSYALNKLNLTIEDLDRYFVGYEYVRNEAEKAYDIWRDEAIEYYVNKFLKASK